MKLPGVLVTFLFGISTLSLNAASLGARVIPKPLTNHPGSVFLAGEEEIVPLGAASTETWQLLDYDDKTVATFRASGDRLSLGRLPTGFYRLRREGHSEWISCAVLAPLRAPTPSNSPVALDVAMAWFYPQEKMADASSLCALAGVNWVRDRLTWGQMEPKRDQFSGTNRYDFSARAQAGAGLRVLQVNHSSPSWANPQTKRFPLDLRDAYRFHRELAQRWR